MKASEALQVAIQHHQAGRLDLAELVYRRILEAEPDHADALHRLGVLVGQTGRFSAAIELIERAIGLRGTDAAFHNNLGEAHRRLGKIGEAIACYRRALNLKPGYAGAYHNWGTALRDQGRFDDAILCFRQALELNPTFVDAYNNLGGTFQDLGRLDLAIDCYRTALRIDPEYHLAWNNYLCALRYDPRLGLAGLNTECAAYAHRYLATLQGHAFEHPNSADSERPLRLGFVSPKFTLGPVASFLLRTLEHLDGQQFSVFCYSLAPAAPTDTARFEALSRGWRDCAQATDERLAAMLAEDRLDILFDLAGYAPFHRLQLFARKPVPIQITWIDSVGTTGIAAIDYLLADRWLIPDAAETHYSEKVLRLPNGYVCYDPPAEAPAVATLPALTRGHVTFGSFNQPAKMNLGVVQCWARILHRLPGSRLVLKYRGQDSPEAIRYWQQMFAAEGVAGERLEFQGHSPFPDYLGEYNRIDISLDPFPHNGGATTCHALWMGVPVVTCPGQTFASRQSLSHLSNIGLTETIARNLDEYVDIAVGLAQDLPRLAKMRAELRPRMAASPLCDGRRFAANLMALLRNVWRQWCQRSATG
jgi:predicted O-linked N-acetylglucosamine transferase (SPINDLY family)